MTKMKSRRDRRKKLEEVAEAVNAHQIAKGRKHVRAEVRGDKLVVVVHQYIDQEDAL